MSTGRTVILLTLAGLLWLPPAQADHKYWKPSVCEQSAKTLYLACHADVRDNFYTTSASCQNFDAWQDRRECYSDAYETRSDEAGECGDVYEARVDACDLLGENRYDPDPLLDENIDFVDPDDVGMDGDYMPNPYVSVVAGHTYVTRSDEELTVVHVTDQIREIQDVPCRVVADIVFETSEEDGEVEYEAIEATDDLFAQDADGNLYYCGEVSRDYEDGVLRSLDGSFESGIDYAKAGTLIRSYPIAGDAHRQEYSPNEAEDIVQYVTTSGGPSEEEGGDNENFPCNETLCLQNYEFGPIDPDAAEFKYYLPGTGFVLAVGIEEGEFTGEREELVCTGDSLEILNDDDCGIDDPEVLLEELCKLSPDAFCAQD
jgi:hypothetical protein